MNDLLRNIPSVTELLESDEIQVVLESTQSEFVVAAARQALDRLRNAILAHDEHEVDVQKLTLDICKQVKSLTRSPLQSCINATGIILHTGLGRAPLAQQAVDAMAEAGQGYSSVELNLETGKRSKRVDAVEKKLLQLFGGEASAVVNNNAGATMLALAALSAGKEAVVSRGELVEIGGSFRMPDVMKMSQAVLREVGTTNKTRATDYEAAIDEQTAVLMKVHCSNYEIQGFSQSTSVEELVEIAERHKHVVVVDDIGSGALYDYSQFGIQDEPLPSQSLQAGADVVLFSGDKLLGGPQCGILIGKREALEKISTHPMMRALRLDKTILAALSATLDLYLGPDPTQSVPILQLISTPLEELQTRAESLAESISEISDYTATAMEDVTYLGGGSVPTQEIETWSVSIKHAQRSDDELSLQLRTSATPVLGRIRQNEFKLDLRSVFPHQDQLILEAFQNI
ncbi:MAG: L-seryl-tRNA(Sec) selenium transferase [Pirellulales bacterium]|nr:L-seryl-tRNA(Sec) selenium transferase [Pirellulales bacterium]